MGGIGRLSALLRTDDGHLPAGVEIGEVLRTSAVASGGVMCSSTCANSSASKLAGRSSALPRNSSGVYAVRPRATAMRTDSTLWSMPTPLPSRCARLRPTPQPMSSTRPRPRRRMFQRYGRCGSSSAPPPERGATDAASRAAYAGSVVSGRDRGDAVVHRESIITTGRSCLSRLAAFAAFFHSRTLASESVSWMSATLRGVASPNLPAAASHPSGCTPMRLPSSATKIFAFSSP